MSTALYALGRWSFRHPWRVLVSWLLLLVLAGGGVALFAKGTDNSFSIPGTESSAGLAQLNRTFPQASGTSAQFIVVAPDGSSVRSDAIRGDVEATISKIEKLDGVLAVTDPYSKTVSGLVSDDATAAIVRLQFDGEATDVPATTKADLTSLVDDLRAELPRGSEVSLGGDLFTISVPALSLIEAVGLLIALLVLIVTFRSFVVAGLPLLSAILGVGLSMALIFVATAFATVSSTTPLLALMLGLAVGIDYALFIIARHQDQVRAGEDPEESAARATATAGSAVVFAGTTVLIALVGLAFANIPFLTTMGIAAAGAVAIAVLVAVTLTPAFLGFAKGRVAGWRPRRPRAADAAADADADSESSVEETPNAATPGARASDTRAVHATKTRRGFASRWVGLVTRHPVVTTVAVVLTLGVLAIPATSLALALPNAGTLAKDSPARETYDLVSEHFGPGFNGPLIMTGTIVTSNDPVKLMTDLGDEIASLPGVETVSLATPNQTADTGIVQLIPTTAPDDPKTAALVRELRAQHDHLLKKYGVDLKVTGFTAVQIDISDRLGAALVPFGIFVVGLSLILLTIVFRSIWVPLKAALGYLLSVGAAFGIVGAVFIHGWGAELFHVAKVGPIISFMPIILMGVLFGLAMDYEVFLVSRMREDFVHARRANGGRADRRLAVEAVRSGFTASSRVVTAAAVIMFAVFAAFVPEGDASLKPIALGLAAGILIDAFLVRMTLVPAVMALLGEKAWWMPRWLERALPHFDIEGEAIEHEFAHADWPDEGGSFAVAAEDLALESDEGTLYDGVDVRLEPGGSLIVTAPDPRSSRALLLSFAGRLDPTDGLLRVDGHLLPGRAAWVRRHVAVALLAGSDDPVRDVREALRGRARFLAIDGLDAPSPSVRDQIAAALRDSSHRGPVTLLVSAADPAVARGILADAGRHDAELVDVGAQRKASADAHPSAATATATAHATEVIA